MGLSFDLLYFYLKKKKEKKKLSRDRLQKFLK